MTKNKTTHLNSKVEVQTQKDLEKATVLFLKLSPEAQEGIIKLLHSIVDKK